MAVRLLEVFVYFFSLEVEDFFRLKLRGRFRVRFCLEVNFVIVLANCY